MDEGLDRFATEPRPQWPLIGHEQFFDLSTELASEPGGEGNAEPHLRAVKDLSRQYIRVRLSKNPFPDEAVEQQVLGQSRAMVARSILVKRSSGRYVCSSTHSSVEADGGLCPHSASSFAAAA